MTVSNENRSALTVVDAQPVEPDRPAAGQQWNMHLDDGSTAVWRSTSIGPRVLSAGAIERHCLLLLGCRPEHLDRRAGRELVPVRSPDERLRTVVIHSATSLTRAFERDVVNALAHQPAGGTSAQIETRSVYLARPGDYTVGRTAPWREAAEYRGVVPLDIGHDDYYYLSHALLVAAARHDTHPLPALQRLIGILRRAPAPIFKLYALDTEVQIFLLWLRRRANVVELRVDGNAGDLVRTWNQKKHLHPEVRDAATLRIAGGPGGLQIERRRSELFRTLGHAPLALPGYSITRPDATGESFADDVILAARLLRTRHGVDRGCLKPSRASNGAWIRPDLDLRDESALRSTARTAYRNNDDYLLEAHLYYRTFASADHSFELAPSGHVRYGVVADGLTAQLMNGRSWGGNAFIDREVCECVGLSVPQYDTMRGALRDLSGSFAGPSTGHRQLLQTAGMDFAVGMIAPDSGGDTVAATDINLLSSGVEYMRTFRERVLLTHGACYVATRVIRPGHHATLPLIDRAVAAIGSGSRLPAEAVAVVPGQWALIAAAGDHPRSAIARVLGLTTELVNRGLAV